MCETKLRKSVEDSLDNELKQLLVNPLFLMDLCKDEINLEVTNPYTLDHLKAKLKQMGHITDSSFSSEIMKLSTWAFSSLVMHYIEN